MEREEPGEAIPHFEQALALSEEERPGVHLSLGWALQEEGRLAEARAHYETALQIQPDSAAAQLNIGGLSEEQGQMDEAEAAFRTALRLQPNFPIPHARLATLLRGKLPDEDLAATGGAGWPIPTCPRARAPGSSSAWPTCSTPAAITPAPASASARPTPSARSWPRGSREYVPAEHERFVDGLIKTLRRRVLRPQRRGRPRLAPAGLRLRPAALGHDADRAGPRQPLADPRRRRAAAGPATVRGHPRRAGPDRAAHRVRPLTSTARPSAGWPSSTSSGSRAIAGDRPDRVVDKMPDNYMYLGLLSVVFPRATFIHCRRDLRDIAVSCWMTDFRSIRWANDPEHIASRFQQYRRLMDHWQAVLPAPIHDVDYEETVDDLEAVARRLIAACGLEWEPACLEFHRNERPIRTASVTQVRQPVYKRSVARWKNYEAALGELFAALPVLEGRSDS